MWVGFCEFDYLLGDIGSLKQKRSVVRPLVSEIRRRFAVSVAEVGHLDAHRRTTVGVGLVSADRAHLIEVLDSIERFAAQRPEVSLLSSRRRILQSDDI